MKPSPRADRRLPRLQITLLASVPVNAPLLTLLTAAIAALLGLGGIGAAWRQQARPIVWCAAAVAGVAAGLALLDLLLGEPAAAITLPVGLPGATFRLVLDPLAAFFAAGTVL